MTAKEKIEFIRNYIEEYTQNNNIDLDCSVLSGWSKLLDVYEDCGGLSYEFRVEMEREIDSMKNLVLDLKLIKKENRIPALHKKGTILRTVSSDPFHIKHIMRVNDDSENGFTDYDITHYDLEVLILDPSVEFVQTGKGNFLDYTKEAMEIS